MVRKRSLSAVLDKDDFWPIAILSSRIRSTSHIFNKNLLSLHSRSNLEQCNCYKCNGRLVNSRTKRIHEIIHQSDQNSDDLDDLTNVTLLTIYLPNELSNLSQQIPNLSIKGDECEEASISRSSSRPDKIQEQEEDYQDNSLAFLP